MIAINPLFSRLSEDFIDTLWRAIITHNFMVFKFQFDEVLFMKKSISRIIGGIMLIIAIVFIMFALNHPEKSFLWNNTITWLLYGVYFLLTVVLLIAPKMKK